MGHRVLNFACGGRAVLLSIFASGAVSLSACSHTPVQKNAQLNSIPTFPAPTITADPRPYPADPTVSDSTAEALSLDSATEPKEPKNGEEAVALAVAEQNLLDRMRAGFQMEDADHVAIDREVAWFVRHDDYLDRTFRRAERYLYFIVEELEARKMPLELALLPIVESAFNPTALSKARAAGLWQFIPSTGRRYGLEQNHQYDGRRDVMESTRAALDYLQFLANEFDGNWYHAVAAYNAGEMNVSRAIARNQARGRPTDFFSLDLPRETRAYVPKLLAMRRIVAQPEKYGLEFGHIANQPYFAKVELDGPIDLGVAAKLAGMPVEDLVALNPAFHRAVMTTDGSGYLLVPTDHAEQLRAGLAALQSPEQRVPKIYYTVHRGDTVSSVARKLGVTSAELLASNKLRGNTLHLGQELVIERGSTSIPMPSAEPVSSERFVTRDPSVELPPIPPPEKRSPSTRGGRHTVHSGETLWSIARTYGISIEELAAENNLRSKARLTKGQKLWIPRVGYEGTTLAANSDHGDTVQRITYVVRIGDSLSHVAKMFRVRVHDLLVWNKLTVADGIKAGQKLVMYVNDARRSGG